MSNRICFYFDSMYQKVQFMDLNQRAKSKISGSNKARDLMLQLIYLFCKDFERKSCQVVSALLKVILLENNKSAESVSRAIKSVQILAFQVLKLVYNNAKDIQI